MRTEEALYDYKGYYVIERKFDPKKNRIAIIGNSEHGRVYTEYTKEKTKACLHILPTRLMGILSKFFPKVKVEDKMSQYPVENVYECFKVLFEKKTDACIVGGYEKEFVEKFPKLFEGFTAKNKVYGEKLNEDKVYFWTLQATQEENWKCIEIIAIWNLTQKILNDNAAALKEIQNEILCRVNRDRDIAFFTDFTDLWDVLTKHKTPIDDDGNLFQVCSEMIPSKNSDAT